MCTSILHEIENKKILITGATGLIGQNIIKSILKYNIEYDGNIQIYALVRNVDKAERIFGLSSYIKYIEGNVIDAEIDCEVDYVIHSANTTSSKEFVMHPVDTISVAVDGTRNILEQIKDKNITKFIYLSSMEVYGTPQDDLKINEEHSSNLDTMQVRSCYPESKRMCENICIAYASQYNIPVNVIRLTQTFGRGVAYSDGRVFAEFARCVIEKKNIVLKTKGKTMRSYLSVDDAVSAIFHVLVKAPRNEAYNVANEQTYCSIYEMANLVADKLTNNSIEVKIEEDNNCNSGFAPELHMNLDTTKIKQLGWEPKNDLINMYIDMIDYMKKHIG